MTITEVLKSEKYQMLRSKKAAFDHASYCFSERKKLTKLHSLGVSTLDQKLESENLASAKLLINLSDEIKKP